MRRRKLYRSAPARNTKSRATGLVFRYDDFAGNDISALKAFERTYTTKDGVSCSSIAAHLVSIFCDQCR